jgi:hypothetical protein
VVHAVRLRSCRCVGCLRGWVLLALSFADSFIFGGLLGVLSVRALPFFSASSAAFAASSMDGTAFELARLGAIMGCLCVARTVGAKCWNLLSWAS